ncbi:MAG: hypothetical protein KA096_02765 [Bacteroidales bacterium]|nr:hypothetical protein [Bacteroidales bacterium]
MKVDEYLPLYRLLHIDKYFIGVDGKQMTVNELFEQYPEFELTDIHIEFLNCFDRASLCKTLKDEYFTPKTVMPFLRELFDNYRMETGEPLFWLVNTFAFIKDNPGNFKPEIRGAIEEALLKWIEIYSNLPYEEIEDEIEPEQNPQELSPTKKIIIEELETIDNNQGWQYAFSSEKDKDIFIELLTLYFELKPYQLPTKPIKLRRRSKTKLASVLNNIYKQLGQSELKSNTKFFALVRVLNHFESYTNFDIYKALTR